MKLKNKKRLVFRLLFAAIAPQLLGLAGYAVLAFVSYLDGVFDVPSHVSQVNHLFTWT